MADGYRIIGAEMSPYSVKVRSYFRYKGIPHQWVLRNAASQAEYEKHARMPIIPLVITPDGTGIQDSTPSSTCWTPTLQHGPMCLARVPPMAILRFGVSSMKCGPIRPSAP